jgi:HSP20 family molecular chaperone IbpA
MRSLTPWTQIADLGQELDRLFDREFVSRWDEFTASDDSVSSLELTETEDALVVKMAVPGMDATFKNGLLVVTLPRMPAAKGSTIPVKPEWPT